MNLFQGYAQLTRLKKMQGVSNKSAKANPFKHDGGHSKIAIWEKNGNKWIEKWY